MSDESAKDADGENRLVREIKDLFGTIAVFLPIWFMFMMVFFELRSIPSESMMPNLQVGDRVAVSKFTYGYSKHSVPFGLGRLLPLPDGRFLGRAPERGEVAVFKHPYLDRVMIKRLIAVPGDTIQIQNNRILLNGEVVPQDPQRRVEYLEARRRIPTSADELMETLPGGKEYLVHDILGDRSGSTPVFVVPEGHYFFMGDNRDNSADSRVLLGHCPESSSGVIDQAGCPPRSSFSEPTIGFVPHDHLIGKAEIVLFTLNFCGRYESGCPQGRVWKTL